MKAREYKIQWAIGRLEEMVGEPFIVRNRRQSLQEARAVLAWYLRDILHLTYEEVGKWCGRHYTTMIYNVGLVREIIEHPSYNQRLWKFLKEFVYNALSEN